jgi:50S ribosomal protein L16 3-hydroxylase
MLLSRLLGEISPAEFIENFFLRQPFSLPARAAPWAALGDWNTLETILASPTADVLVAKQGQRWEGSRAPTFAEARELFDAGHTVLARHAERCHSGIAQLASEFEAEFLASVDVHLYYTPAGQHGFGWHYDAEDVFILQASGDKEYSFRKNTVNPWPLVETLPDDMQYQREIMPLGRCLLAAGDWLYLPHGWWHKAEARCDCVSLAVGVLSPAALDVYDFVRGRLLSSFQWRQRLPVSGAAAPRTPEDQAAEYEQLFATLGADLARLFSDESLVRDYLASRAQRGNATA